jgi:SAM-dependent methyltransferase
VLDPRPSPDEIGAYYDGYYPKEEFEARRQAMKHQPSVFSLGLDWLKALDAVKRLKKQGVDLKPETQLLDVGCGAGGFLRAMREQARVSTRGVDFNPRCQAFADSVYEVEVDVGDLEDQGYDDGQFDIVSSWHCLEHTYAPDEELEEIARIVKPDGWLLIEVPTPGFWARLFRGRWLFLQAPTHLFHLRPQTVLTMLENAGFSARWTMRTWVPSEFAGSLMMALGFSSFAPRILFKPAGPVDHLWRLLFVALMPLDLLLTGVVALFGGAGVLRVLAQRDSVARDPDSPT